VDYLRQLLAAGVGSFDPDAVSFIKQTSLLLIFIFFMECIAVNVTKLV